LQHTTQENIRTKGKGSDKLATAGTCVNAHAGTSPVRARNRNAVQTRTKRTLLQDATLNKANVKRGKLTEHSGAREWPGTLKRVRRKAHHSMIIKEGADPSGARKVLCSTTQTYNVRVARESRISTRFKHTPRGRSFLMMGARTSTRAIRVVGSRTTKIHNWS
jgi:hypothetical protein